MTWFKSAQQKNGDSNLLKTIESQIKDMAVSKHQEGHSFTLYDVQRYIIDSYAVRLALSETPIDIKVSVMINHNFLGSVAWSEYWSFEKDEKSTAKKFYKEIAQEVEKINDEFIVERKPTSIYAPTLRSRLEKMYKKDRTHTNIPVVNYSHDLETEPDWRSNIYGTRYPGYVEKSHKQFYKL